MGSGIRYGVSLETQFLKHGNDHLNGDGLELFSDEDEAVDESLDEPVVVGEVLALLLAGFSFHLQHLAHLTFPGLVSKSQEVQPLQTSLEFAHRQSFSR